jgi:RimJ/RimL family protein N-acetyltransferase
VRSSGTTSPVVRRSIAPARVALRAVTRADVATFYRQLNDPGARWMAAFGPRGEPDLRAWRERWARLLSTPAHVFRTVVVDDRVAGYIGRFPLLGQPSVAYWYGRRFWGRGIATQALQQFMRVDPVRPVFARVAHDNLASRRVLEKCGFVAVGRARSLAPARNRRLTELILRLGATPARAGRRRATR